MTLNINNLHASIDGKEILKGVSLDIRPGEIHALMGPNGSGKSTLAHALMGKPDVNVTKGTITLDGENLLILPPHERARRGLFLGFQHPIEIPGVSVSKFLRLAKMPPLSNSATSSSRAKPRDLGQTHSLADFHKDLEDKAAHVGIPNDFLNRDMNVGFSGGEKKRLEILQMLLLQPHDAILDEPDSGLDIDALKLIAKTIQKIAKENKIGILLITHSARILHELTPDAVHVFVDGKIIKSGGRELAEELEENGYQPYVQSPTSSRAASRDLVPTV